jgi:hypothetical protein
MIMRTVKSADLYGYMLQKMVIFSPFDGGGRDPSKSALGWCSNALHILSMSITEKFVRSLYLFTVQRMPCVVQAPLGAVGAGDHPVAMHSALELFIGGTLVTKNGHGPSVHCYNKHTASRFYSCFPRVSKFTPIQDNPGWLFSP